MFAKLANLVDIQNSLFELHRPKIRHERNKSSTHHGVFDVFNRLQEDRSGSDGTMMMLLLLLMMVVLLLLMVMVLLVVRIAIGDIRAGAVAANVAGLLAGEEVSY